MVVKVRRHRCSVRGLLKHGEREKGAGRGAVKLGGGACLLWGAGERQGGVAGEFNAGVNGFNAIEDGGGFKRGFKGGEMKARW
jgi:hypothetical protein